MTLVLETGKKWEPLRADLRGELILPDDERYEGARRVWNGMIDRRPAAIVRCADADDVARAVEHARRANLTVAVRGGGHNTAGLATCEGGMVIDLSAMKGITINSSDRTARAEAGLTLGEFVNAAEQHGLVTTTGIVSDTGLAGLTLGGGVGWLMGKYGLTCDNVRAFEVVTADSQFLRAGANDHPDLYWGLRGGGGNFGIVTAFELQLHPLRRVLGGMVVHPLPRAKEVLHFYREFTKTAPDELTVYAGILTSPDGHPVVAMVACWSGDPAEGIRVLEPLRRFGPPVADTIHAMPYSEMVTMLDAVNPPGARYYEKGGTLAELGDDAIEAITANGMARTSPLSMCLIQHLHGAAARVARDATPFALRQNSYIVVNVAHWIDGPGDAHIAWSRAAWQALQPFALDGTYVNFLNEDSAARVRASYGVNYERLVALKKKYDPANFFHLNQNIPPTVDADGGW